MAALVGVGLIMAIIWTFPAVLNRSSSYSPAEAVRLNAINGTRVALVALCVGLAGVVTLAYTARSYNLARTGQVTERYTRAIEQLGCEKREVRLGGIYALERIARDSTVDRLTIFKILCAFVRDRSSGDAPVTEDIQAALDVLSRARRRGYDGPIDLRGAQLRGASLANGRLDLCLLEGANLENADLTDTYLSGASLKRAILRGVNFSGAHLLRADLIDAQLEGAQLYGAHVAEDQLSDGQLKAVHNAEHRIRYRETKPGSFARID